MDSELEEAARQRHREVLSSLSRRELQARAKSLGVRANGKSVDIIESVARVLSRPGSPVKYAASDSQGEDDRENARDNDNTGKRCASAKAPESVGNEPSQEGKNMVNGRTGALSASDAIPVPHASTPAGQEETNGEGQQPASSPGAFDGAGCSPDLAQAGSALTPATSSLAELAARASAAALAASLNNLHLDSQLKAGIFRKSSTYLRRDNCQPLLLDSMQSCSDDTSPRSGTGESPLSTDAQEEYCEESAPKADQHLLDGERNEPTSESAPLAAESAGSVPARTLDFPVSPLPAHSNAHRSVSPREQQQEGHSSPLGLQDGEAPAPFSFPHSTSVPLRSSRAEATVPPPLLDASCPQQLTFAVPSGVGATTPTVVRQASAASRPLVCVTDRTPLRQQRLFGLQLQPTAPAAATPVGRGAVPPRTPGTGLRTPARRVPVCTDEARERAMDEWVTQHLVVPPASKELVAGPAWEELVGLTEAKQRLQELCIDRTTTNEDASPSILAPTRASAAGSSLTAGASKDCPGGRTAAASPASGQSRVPKPSSGNLLSNAAIMLLGPPGIGKSSLARALATQLGGTYIHVPPDLAKRVAVVPGGADVVLRSVARVATQIPGPVIVHVEDVEKLAGVEAAKQSQDYRRLRTELVVAVDELLVQHFTALSSPGQNGPSATTSKARTASPASSGTGAQSNESRRCAADSNGNNGRSRFKVLVLSTTSHPMALDATLAASLARTERVLVGPLGAEDREAYLVGRLASEGAALGVEEVDRLVRQTEGLSCAQLADLCDGAIKAAAARRASSPAQGPTSLNEVDLGLALQYVGHRFGPDEMAELERWHVRMGTAQNRRGP